MANKPASQETVFDLTVLHKKELQGTTYWCWMWCLWLNIIAELCIESDLWKGLFCKSWEYVAIPREIKLQLFNFSFPTFSKSKNFREYDLYLLVHVEYPLSIRNKKTMTLFLSNCCRHLNSFELQFSTGPKLLGSIFLIIFFFFFFSCCLVSVFIAQGHTDEALLISFQQQHLVLWQTVSLTVLNYWQL